MVLRDASASKKWAIEQHLAPAPFSSDYPPSFCTCCPKIFPPGAVHHVQKELLRLGSTLVHVQPCSTFLSHKHALDWEQFKVVLWQNFREFRMGLLVLAAVPHISIDLFLPPTQSDLLPTDSPSPAEKLYSAGNSLWPGECMTTFIPPPPPR